MDYKTVRYYDDEALALADQYESAPMAPTHALLVNCLPKGGAVLDVGCGSGRDSAFLLSRGFDMTAVDPSSHMLSAAQHLHPQLGGRLVCASVPLPSGHYLLSHSFAAVIAIAVIMHMTDCHLILALSQFADMLCDGGVLFIVSSIGRPELRETRDRTGRLFVERSADTLGQLLLNSGLQVTNVLTTGDGMCRPIQWINVTATLSR